MKNDCIEALTRAHTHMLREQYHYRTDFNRKRYFVILMLIRKICVSAEYKTNGIQRSYADEDNKMENINKW